MKRDELKSQTATRLGIGVNEVLFTEGGEIDTEDVERVRSKIDDDLELVWLECQPMGKDNSHFSYHEVGGKYVPTLYPCVLTDRLHANRVANHACPTCFPDDPSADDMAVSYGPNGERLVRPADPDENDNGEINEDE